MFEIHNALIHIYYYRHRLSFHIANQIIDAVNNKQLPKNIMFTFHPQRWTDNPVLWLKELLLQRVKNVIKRVMYV